MPRGRFARRLAPWRPIPGRPVTCKLIDSDDLYRVRAGNYRIVYTIKDTAIVVEVVKVGDRKDIYGP